MSQYINSFLIEPVVRQARRFSRPSNDDPSLRPVDNQPSPEDGAAGPSRASAEAARNNWRSTVFRSASPTATAVSEAMPTYSEDPGLEEENQVSSNPVYGIPESLRSTTSSISNSANLATHPDSLETQGPVRSTSQNNGGTNSCNSQHSEGSLPADDGMGLLRKRIVAIQRTDSSSTEKATLVHRLMTEQYSSSQSSLQAPRLLRACSSTSLASHERPTTPSSGHSRGNSVLCTSPPTSLSSVADANNPFNLCPEDLKPTYCRIPKALPSSGELENLSSHRLSQDSNEEFKALGCPHYKRNIKLQCSTCYRWYTCRFCHDEVENHSLNRRETKNMLCMFCRCAQPAAGACVQCGERSARYYCCVCKLWDDDPGKRIYHCDDCGICRIGEGLGKDFFHCKTCCACLSIRTWENHRCIERSTDCDCPICGEYMFTSPQTVVFMRCGHSIHHRCYREYMKRSYRCPICSKSIHNMEMQFRRLEQSIESQPMPPEFQDTKAWVYCNDCNAKSSVKYHWLGLKCGVCDSYNTAQLQMIRGANQGGIPHGNTETAPRVPSPQLQGRAMDITAQAQRAANSAQPSNPDLPTHDSPWRHAMSQDPQGVRPLPREVEDSMEVSFHEADNDVDFWGLESPNTRAQRVLQSESMDDDSEDDDDSENETSPSDDDWDTTGDAGGDEDEEEDDMEIFGHR